MRSRETNSIDAQTVALMALGWLLADERRADRLLTMTGLDPEALRTGIGDPVVLGAMLGFLEGHEPDLIACAEAIGVKPETIVAAQRSLGA